MVRRHLILAASVADLLHLIGLRQEVLEVFLLRDTHGGGDDRIDTVISGQIFQMLPEDGDLGAQAENVGPGVGGNGRARCQRRREDRAFLTGIVAHAPAHFLDRGETFELRIILGHAIERGVPELQPGHDELVEGREILRPDLVVALALRELHLAVGLVAVVIGHLQRRTEFLEHRALIGEIALLDSGDAGVDATFDELAETVDLGDHVRACGILALQRADGREPLEQHLIEPPDEAVGAGIEGPGRISSRILLIGRRADPAQRAENGDGQQAQNQDEDETDREPEAPSTFSLHGIPSLRGPRAPARDRGDAGRARKGKS